MILALAALCAGLVSGFIMGILAAAWAEVRVQHDRERAERALRPGWPGTASGSGRSPN